MILHLFLIAGYKYHEEDLLAIARLRGTGLQKLDIAYDDVLVETGEDINNKNIKVSRLIFFIWIFSLE